MAAREFSCFTRDTNATSSRPDGDLPPLPWRTRCIHPSGLEVRMPSRALVWTLTVLALVLVLVLTIVVVAALVAWLLGRETKV